MYTQFSSVLIVRLEVDRPWKEVGGGIKTGGAINLLGFSQSITEDSPPKRGLGESERESGGGGGSRGGGRSRGRKHKCSKLNPVEEDYDYDEDEEEEKDERDGCSPDAY